MPKILNPLYSFSQEIKLFRFKLDINICMNFPKKLNLTFVISLIYFLACYALASHWYFSQYFEVYDIFFDTDPVTTLRSFESGGGRQTYIHAFLELFAIPIRACEYILSKFFVLLDAREFRELLAIAIAPFFSVLTIVYFHRILKLLKFTKF